MQRTQSTPALAKFAPASALAKTVSLVDVRARAPPRPRTPRAEREDPFHLGGFFPAPAKADGDWAWLRSEEEAAEKAAAAHALFALPEEESEDGEPSRGKVSKVIEGEDKLGVLAMHLERLLVARPEAAEGDEAMPSTPLIPDEPADDEALFRTLCARRLAFTNHSKSTPASVDGASVLFRPADDADDVDPGWLDTMRRAIRLL